jgi:hypothetical protein
MKRLLIIDALAIGSIPLTSIYFVVGQNSIKKNLIGISILTITCCIVVMSHSSELLSLKKTIVGIYGFLVVIGYCVLIFFPYAPAMIISIIMSSLAMITILVPGAFRFILYMAGSLKPKRQVGMPEAISLYYVRIPWEIQRVRNSLRYSLYNYPWKNRIRTIVSSQIIISLIYKVIRLSNTLSEATVNRRYSLRTCTPNVELFSHERIIYLLFSGMLIVLKSMNNI